MVYKRKNGETRAVKGKHIPIAKVTIKLKLKKTKTQDMMHFNIKRGKNVNHSKI
jgi:hypothetical protein